MRSGLCLFIFLISVHAAAASPPCAFDFSGQQSIPALGEVSMTISDDAHPIGTRIFLSIVRIEDLATDVRALLKSLKRDAQPLTENEAEMGAVIARYVDGTSKGIRFTSRKIDHITGVDMAAGMNTSGIFNRAHLKLVIKMHTHPDLTNPIFGGRRKVILPSNSDYDYWISLRAQLRAYHPDVAFQAIVVPAALAVNDIAFVVSDRNLEAYLKAKDDNLVLTAMSAR